jgi:kelch-like protein 2/3
MTTKRVNIVAAVVNDIIYIVHTDSREVEAYDPSTETWTAKTPMQLSHSDVTELNGKIYAMGGYDRAQGGPTGSVEVYDPATNVWTPKKSMSKPRASVGIGTMDGLIYAVGGDDTPGACGTSEPHDYSKCDDNIGGVQIVEAYDPSTDSWSLRAPQRAHTFERDIVAIDHVLYAVGGITYDQSLTSVEAFQP